MAIQLTVMSLDFESFEEPVTKVFTRNEVTIGRSKENDLVLDRPEISGNHCKLFTRQNGGQTVLYVVDLGSSNGTLVERDTLSPHEDVCILPNQRIIVGSYLIKPSFAADRAYQSQEKKSEEFKPLTASITALSEDYDREEILVSPASVLKNTNGKHTTELPDIQMDMVENSGDYITLNVSADRNLDIDFLATELLDLTGSVSVNGQPLADVEVDAGVTGKTLSDSQGKFYLTDIPEGMSLSVSAKKTGFVFEPRKFQGTASSNLRVDFQATRLLAISGRVLHKNQGLAGVVIDGGPLGQTFSDENGSFIFDGVRDATAYDLVAQKDRYRFSSQNSKGTLRGEHVEITFAGTQLLRVSGRVLHKGQPLVDVEVESIEYGKVRTDNQGRYSFDDIPEGTQLNLKVKKSGFIFSQH